MDLGIRFALRDLHKQHTSIKPLNHIPFIDILWVRFSVNLIAPREELHRFIYPPPPTTEIVGRNARARVRCAQCDIDLKCELRINVRTRVRDSREHEDVCICA